MLYLTDVFDKLMCTESTLIMKNSYVLLSLRLKFWPNTLEQREFILYFIAHMLFIDEAMFNVSFLATPTSNFKRLDFFMGTSEEVDSDKNLVVFISVVAKRVRNSWKLLKCTLNVIQTCANHVHSLQTELWTIIVILFYVLFINCELH